ncbi:hypothetical protein KGY73_10830, partial [bacterium]|nr:hypothetical protein [bacterium]
PVQPSIRFLSPIRLRREKQAIMQIPDEIVLVSFLALFFNATNAINAVNFSRFQYQLNKLNCLNCP